MAGVDMPEREQWSITDVTPAILDHFGISGEHQQPEKLA